jgi:hypothetical protein
MAGAYNKEFEQCIYDLVNAAETLLGTIAGIDDLNHEPVLRDAVQLREYVGKIKTVWSFKKPDEPMGGHEGNNEGCKKPDESEVSWFSYLGKGCFLATLTEMHWLRFNRKSTLKKRQYAQYSKYWRRTTKVDIIRGSTITKIWRIQMVCTSRRIST